MRNTKAWAIALVASLSATTACKKEQPKEQPAPARPASATPSASASSMPAPSTEGEDSTGVTKLEAAVKAGDEFGYATAASGDRVVVSAFKRAEGEDKNPGSVFVFKVDGGKAALETELKAENSHQIGNALAFDGTTLVAGAMYDSGASEETGAAYVFTRADSGWSKAQKLSAAAAKRDDSFGIGLALAGKSIVIGNTRDKAGSLFVFEADKTGYKLKQTLPFPEENGPAENIAAFGDVIAVGSENAGKTSEQGLVHAYQRGEKGFTASPPISESEPAESQHFGEDVAVGPKSIAVSSKKQITILEQKDGHFAEAAKIVPPEKLWNTEAIQSSLALGEDVLAVGMPLAEEGRVLVYRKRDGNWKLDRTLKAPDGKKEDWFGQSVALSGKLLVIGAPLKDERAGGAYLYVMP